MKFRFVQEYRETFRVGMMCKVLKVSRSGYYAWRKRPPGQRELEDRHHAVAIKRVFTKFRLSFMAETTGITINAPTKTTPTIRIDRETVTAAKISSK